MCKLLDYKIIAIARGIDEAHIIPTIQALIDGGIKAVELPLSHSSKESYKETLNIIKKAHDTFGDKIYLGAGTVLSTKEVEDAARAGAEYMISPNMNVDVIKKTKELGKGSMPGALTNTEVVTAYEAGADVVKIFPAGNFGESYIKALQGPCDFIPYAAVGGVNADNMKSLMEAGYNMVAVGGNLVNKDLVIKEDYQKITELAKQYVQNI